MSAEKSTITLDEAAFSALKVAIESPGEPAPALIALARRYGQKVGSGELIVDHDTDGPHFASPAQD